MNHNARKLLSYFRLRFRSFASDPSLPNLRFRPSTSLSASTRTHGSHVVDAPSRSGSSSSDRSRSVPRQLCDDARRGSGRGEADDDVARRRCCLFLFCCCCALRLRRLLGLGGAGLLQGKRVRSVSFRAFLRAQEEAEEGRERGRRLVNRKLRPCRRSRPQTSKPPHLPLLSLTHPVLSPQTRHANSSKQKQLQDPGGREQLPVRNPRVLPCDMVDDLLPGRDQLVRGPLERV
jgi:hypothetical protein